MIIFSKTDPELGLSEVFFDYNFEKYSRTFVTNRYDRFSIFPKLVSTVYSTFFSDSICYYFSIRGSVFT